jgi:hypothetical protein
MGSYGPSPYIPQPQQPPRQPPPTQPQRQPGWGRFWLGVLAGGCAVLLVEGIAGLVLVALIGSAIAGALQSGQSGGGAPAMPGVTLPSGVALPAGLPQLNVRSDPCSPRPCLAHGGVTVLVGGVSRGAAGPHLVRMDVTFVGTAGTHTVTTSEVALQEPGGNLALPSAAGDCPAPAALQELQAGQRLGPFPACYSLSGAASAPLTLLWVDPEDFAVVQTRLP